MRTMVGIVFCVFCWLVSADEPRDYIEMDADLTELKADFNAKADQLRLLYIVGPT